MPLPIIQDKDPAQNAKKIKNIVAIAAGKGGVGKSTATVHIAHALRRKGLRVGVLDSDIYGPSIRKMLPEDRMPLQKEGRITPALSQGIEMISMAYFRHEKEAAAVRAPIATGVIKQFLNDVAWGPLDYLLIDFPPGTGDIQLTLAQNAYLTGAVMVTTPQEVALMDVRKAIHLFDQVRVPVIGIIENMSYYRDEKDGRNLYLFGKGGGRKLSDETGVPFLGEVPIDPRISENGDAGLSLIGSGTPAETAYGSIAEALEASAKMAARSIYNKIWLKDPGQLAIEWQDGRSTVYSVGELQKKCPCAACREGTQPKAEASVEAEGIELVGRYAFKLRYTKGCGRGIYTFDMLRESHGS